MRPHKIFAQLLIMVIIVILSTHGGYADDPPPVGQSKSTPSSIPEGQSKEKPISADEGVSSDIFGKQGGNFHPFLIFQEMYTDNIFATNTNTKSDFITTLAPGVWLAFPANREKLLSVDTKTTSPGGLQLSRIKPEATRRYQSYFLYSPEFMLYSDHSSLDHVNHRAEGLFQYNLNSGLSFDIIDLFHDREDIAGNGIIDTLYRYQDNLLDFITTYAAPSGKFKFELEYSNYDIDYEDLAASYRNRNDNSFGVSAFYKFWPKTSLFVEYNFSDIDFDGGTSTDSTEDRYYAGATWDMTAKTRGTLKLGYIEKDFDSPALEDQEGFSVELQTQHHLSPKRGLQINGFRKFNESDFGDASTFLSTGIDIALSQRFTEKWSGTFDVSFENNDYKGFDRTDDLFGLGPALRFEPRKWLIFDLGYHYYLNDSNITVYDYEANQVYFRATLSM
jgi:hypothetical protein